MRTLAKEALGVRSYARYCDDLVLFGSSKQWLHEARRWIQDYLWRQLRLELKPNWQVFPTRTRGVDFLGYRFFGYRTLVRKTIAKRFKRKMLKMPGKPHRNALSSLMSYSGWFKFADASRLWNAHVSQELLDRAQAMGN